MDWKQETAADLKDAEVRLLSVIRTISSEPTEEELKSLWRAYLDVEKSVVFIKVELDEENPGRFVNTKLYRVPDERQAVRFALDRLKKGEESFRQGFLLEGLKELRECRNYLRMLLREKRLTRVKRARSLRNP